MQNQVVKGDELSAGDVDVEQVVMAHRDDDGTYRRAKQRASRAQTCRGAPPGILNGDVRSGGSVGGGGGARLQRLVLSVDWKLQVTLGSAATGRAASVPSGWHSLERWAGGLAGEVGCGPARRERFFF